MIDTHNPSAQTVADPTNTTCLQCHHTFQSLSKLQKHQTETKNQCKHVVKDHTCEHCHASFESEKSLQRHLQRKQDVCVLIQELKATHKEELDQVHQEMAVHKEELGKVQQELGLAATTVLHLQNRLKAATSTPEAVSEAAERRLMQKLIDIEQKVTNVGKSWDIKAVVCPETHVHTGLTTSDMFAESCELSIPTKDATVDVNDLRSLMNMPGIDSHSNPKPHHLEDGAEIARAQQTADGQVAFENANLLLSAECGTETLASTTRSQRQSLRAHFSHNKFQAKRL